MSSPDLTNAESNSSAGPRKKKTPIKPPERQKKPPRKEPPPPPNPGAPSEGDRLPAGDPPERRPPKKLALQEKGPIQKINPPASIAPCSGPQARFTPRDILDKDLARRGDFTITVRPNRRSSENSAWQIIVKNEIAFTKFSPNA
jgi:hypothetical protein